jgi:hypothetical protein
MLLIGARLSWTFPSEIKERSMNRELEAKLLEKIGAKLEGLDPSQPVHYQQRWELWFSDYDEVAVLKRTLQAQDQATPLTRHNLKDLASQAKQRTGQVGPARLLFVATMMWGWGSAARARAFVRAAMCDLEFDNTLLQVQESLRQRDTLAAYAAADRFNGCGEAFATKFLYFMGWPYASVPNDLKHLILDSQVRRALRELLGTAWRETDAFWKGMRAVDVYTWYLHAASNWALTLRIPDRPDLVEQALFMIGQEIGTARGPKQRMLRTAHQQS